MLLRSCRYVLCVFAALVASVGLGSAQVSVTKAPDRTVSVPDSSFSAGLRAWSRRDTSQALRNLRQAFEADPTQTLRGGPSVGYWLGHVLMVKGSRHMAIKTWKKTLDAGTDTTRTSLVLADAFLRALRDHEILGLRSVAADAYKSILARTGAALSPTADSIVAVHVAQLSTLLSNDSLNIYQGSPSGRADADRKLRSDAGRLLLKWWRSQDPLPATKRNERLTEHLRRVNYARRQFGCSGTACQPEGWDERGTVYVRFGPPTRRESIRYNRADFNLDVFRSGVSVSRHDFPENELWTYNHIDRSGRYVFVKEGAAFRIGRTNDLLPRTLRRGISGRTDRSLNRAYSSLAALRHIYEKLALHHGDYAQRYSEVQNYFSWQQEQGRLVKMGALPKSRVRTVGSGPGQTRSVGPGPGPAGNFPNEFVTSRLRESEMEDRRSARERDREMPTAFSNVGSNENPLPVAVRTSRFLTASGSTKVQIAWGHPAGSLSPGERVRDLGIDAGDINDSFVRLWAVQYDPNYRRTATSTREYHVAHRKSERRRPIVDTLSINGRSDPFHLRLQWNQNLDVANQANRDTSSLLLRRSVRTIEETPILRPGNESSLLMSDLMPCRLEQGKSPVKQHLSLYPFSTLDSDGQISIYFELYNLALDENGRSRYTIEYEVVRPEEDGGLFLGLFGGDDRNRTRTTVTQQGGRSSTEEFIQIDLDEKGEVGKGDLSISVRVTDKITGKTSHRSISFTTTH